MKFLVVSVIIIFVLWIVRLLIRSVLFRHSRSDEFDSFRTYHSDYHINDEIEDRYLTSHSSNYTSYSLQKKEDNDDYTRYYQHKNAKGTLQNEQETRSERSQITPAGYDSSHSDKGHLVAARENGSADFVNKDNQNDADNYDSSNSFRLNKVEFTALAPKTLVKGDDSIISIVMYEEAFRHIVDEIKNDADVPVKETKGGVYEVKRGSSIKMVLTSKDIELEDNTETMTWCGGYLNFTFPVSLPEDYSKSKVMFKAAVYVDDLPVTRLHFTAECMSQLEQKLEIIRKDVLSAFVSYASQDRARVLATVQGMKSIAPQMDIFVDITRLKSGEEWDEALCEEIIRRDIFFLFWSLSASQSKWVEKEWRYALENKGDECIEPVPIEPQGECPPPPEELSHKHFNDPLLYVINACKK